MAGESCDILSERAYGNITVQNHQTLYELSDPPRSPVIYHRAARVLHTTRLHDAHTMLKKKLESPNQPVRSGNDYARAMTYALHRCVPQLYPRATTCSTSPAHKLPDARTGMR